MATVSDRGRSWRRPRFLTSALLGGMLGAAIAAAAFYFGRSDGDPAPPSVDEAALVLLLGIVLVVTLLLAVLTAFPLATANALASGGVTLRPGGLGMPPPAFETASSALAATLAYAGVALLALLAADLGPMGHLALLAGLVGVAAPALVAVLRWLASATAPGAETEAIERLAEAAIASLTPATVGTFGAAVWSGAAPDGARAIYAPRVGYVRNLNVEALDTYARRQGATIVVAVRPGDLVTPVEPFAYVSPASAAPGDVARRLATMIELGRTRHALHDVRFSVLTLSEAAGRALSPAASDPASAIHIVTILLEVMIRWSHMRRSRDATSVRYEHIALPPLTARDLVSDAFTAIARDGAGSIEVVLHLQKVLATLAQLGDPEVSFEVVRMSDVSLEIADGALAASSHRDLAHDGAALVRQAASRPRTGVALD